VCTDKHAKYHEQRTGCGAWESIASDEVSILTPHEIRMVGGESREDEDAKLKGHGECGSNVELPPACLVTNIKGKIRRIGCHVLKDN